VKTRILAQAIGLGAVCRLSDDPQSRLLLQHRAITLAHDRVIIDQHDGAAGLIHAARSIVATP
jgi:hypothetical protein